MTVLAGVQDGASGSPASILAGLRRSPGLAAVAGVRGRSGAPGGPRFGRRGAGGGVGSGSRPAASRPARRSGFVCTLAAGMRERRSARVQLRMRPSTLREVDATILAAGDRWPNRTAFIEAALDLLIAEECAFRAGTELAVGRAAEGKCAACGRELAGGGAALPGAVCGGCALDGKLPGEPDRDRGELAVAQYEEIRDESGPMQARALLDLALECERDPAIRTALEALDQRWHGEGF